MADNEYKIDYAKRVANCKNRRCAQPKIEPKSLRIAKLTKNPFSDDEDSKQAHWFHPPCIFDQLKRAKKTTKKIESTGDLIGWENIDTDDQKLVVDLIDAGYEEEPKPRPRKTPKSAKKNNAPAKKTKKSPSAAGGSGGQSSGYEEEPKPKARKTPKRAKKNNAPAKKPKKSPSAAGGSGGGQSSGYEEEPKPKARKTPKSAKKNNAPVKKTKKSPSAAGGGGGQSSIAAFFNPQSRSKSSSSSSSSKGAAHRNGANS